MCSSKQRNLWSKKLVLDRKSNINWSIFEKARQDFPRFEKEKLYYYQPEKLKWCTLIPSVFFFEITIFCTEILWVLKHFGVFLALFLIITASLIQHFSLLSMHLMINEQKCTYQIGIRTILDDCEIYVVYDISIFLYIL